jgi:hypothetical protein
MSAFHYDDGRPFERLLVLEQQCRMLGFDHSVGGNGYGADLRRRYKGGLLSPADETTLREMGFNFTFGGTCPLITYPNQCIV